VIMTRTGVGRAGLLAGTKVGNRRWRLATGVSLGGSGASGRLSLIKSLTYSN